MAVRAVLIVIGLALVGGQVVEEGQAAVLELAEEVKAWKMDKLPIPFEIENEKDVGYLGGLPINDTWKAEFKQLSLGTGRELQGYPALIMTGRTIIKETGAPTIPPPAWRLGGAGGEEKRHLNGAVNPTSELTLMGWQVNTYLALKDEMDHWGSRAGHKLMVIHSGGDTLAGGCTEDEIKEKYNALIAAAGGTQTIVFAAEVSPFPADLGWRYNLSSSSWAEKQRNDTLNDLNIPENWASTYANCTNGPCGPTMKYQYANSGFIMGPVADLIAMFTEFEKYTGTTNRFINDYFLQHESTVTLDYGGTLALTLNNMGNADSPVFFSRSSGGSNKLFRQGTTTPVCFVHGNGNGFDKLKSLAESITTPVS